MIPIILDKISQIIMIESEIKKAETRVTKLATTLVEFERINNTRSL